MRRSIVLAGLICAFVSTTAFAQPTATPVVATALNEVQPAADGNYVAWAQNSVAAPGHLDAYVMASGGAPIKVNAQGTQGTLGGIDGTTLVFQQFVGRRSSDLKLFDLVSMSASDPPAGVNTDKWEYWPSISGDQLLFGRLLHSGARTVVLFDLTTGDEITLDSAPRGTSAVYPGQVNGNFAVWSGTTPRTCSDVFVYDIQAGTTTRIPNPGGKCQYSPSVNVAGTVFFGRSGPRCGQSARLMSYEPGSSATTLVALPRGTDFGRSFAADNADGSTSVFYDPGSCTGRSSDIYEVTVP